MLVQRRMVTTFNNINSARKVVESAASTWEELQRDLSTAGVAYSGMKVIIGESQLTLESSQAQLPEGDFMLFMVPEKVKSGCDDDMIDTEDGIAFDDYDWDDDTNSVEEHIFKSQKDLNIARAKKASYYLDKVVYYLTNDARKVPVNPELKQLSETAEQIKRNLAHGLFD